MNSLHVGSTLNRHGEFLTYQHHQAGSNRFVSLSCVALRASLAVDMDVDGAGTSAMRRRQRRLRPARETLERAQRIIDDAASLLPLEGKRRKRKEAQTSQFRNGNLVVLLRALCLPVHVWCLRIARSTVDTCSYVSPGGILGRISYSFFCLAVTSSVYGST